MCECSGAEIKNLNVSLGEAGEALRREREARLAAERMGDIYRNDLDNAKAELADVRSDLRQETERANIWKSLWLHKRDTVRELRATLVNTKAELADVRSDLADTTATLDKYRDMHVKRSRANGGIWKSDSDPEDTIRTLTEERDLAREWFQGMATAYTGLLDRYTVKCDDYEGLASRYDVEHGER